MTIENLFKEITKWSKTYEFSFQFWGEANNNVYIYKGGIELADFGGEDTPRAIVEIALEWVGKQNPKGFQAPADITTYCQGCGARIAKGNDFCGECACEDDCDY